MLDHGLYYLHIPEEREIDRLLGQTLPTGSPQERLSGLWNEMLRDVATRQEGGTTEGAWARRTHVFRQVWDLA